MRSRAGNENRQKRVMSCSSIACTVDYDVMARSARGGNNYCGKAVRRAERGFSLGQGHKSPLISPND